MSTEEQLGRTLRAQAEGIDDQPLTLGDVRGRARQIRRRRAAAVAGGLALVAAIALPVALLGDVGGDQSDPDPVKPSPTRAVDPNDEGVPTLQDGVIVYPDGPRIPLRLDHQDQILTFAPLGSDRWVLSVGTDEHGTQVVVVNELGQSVGKYPIDGGMAASDDHRAVAWVAPDGSVQLLVDGADEPRRLSPVDGPNPSAVAITGDCTAACTVHVKTNGQGLGPSWAVASSGGVVPETPAVPVVLDVSSDGSLLAGLRSVAPDGNHYCGGVYDLSVIDYVWEDCEDNVFAFSPDGALVATMFGEGMGPRSVTIRDAHSGTPIAEVDDDRLITSYVWEDDQHLLVVYAADDGNVSVERISVDGPTEIVLDGFHTDDPIIEMPVKLPM
jgi:hypothetical protein